jgi:hypothetical protein
MTSRTSTVGQVARLTLVFDAPRDNPDWPVVKILIDGEDLAAKVAPDWTGFDPDEISGSESPLVPVRPWRPSPDRVTWTDFRDYTGMFTGPLPPREDPEGGREWDLPTVRFSAQQYRDEVKRAVLDRSWETPRHATSRLVRPLVRNLVARAQDVRVDGAALWTGVATFELIDASAQPAWQLEVVLQRELVTLWLGRRNLATIDRDRLPAWAAMPGAPADQAAPLERHDVVLTCLREWIAVSVGEGPPAWLTPVDAARLRAVL